MKRIIVFIASLFSYVLLEAQAVPVESHNFITYDTTFNTINSGSYKFLIRISRPVNMFTPNNIDTASRPLIITGPGQGEMNHGISDTSQLHMWGPHYWTQHGWDGSVVLGNGIHYPVLVTIVPYNGLYPPSSSYAEVLNMILTKYHIKRNSVYAAGLSQSSFTWTAMIGYEQTVGDAYGRKMVTALVALSGFALDNAADSMKYKDWATTYNGKYFGLQGANDVRGVFKGANYVNSVVPGSGYFSYVNINGSTNHCCWNNEYDPNFIDWRTDPSTTKGAYYSGSQPLPFGEGGVNTMGNYKYPGSMFQWMLRQGDTSLVNATVPFGVTEVVPCEYRTFYIMTDSTVRAYNNGSPNIVSFNIGGRKAIHGSGGFNVFNVLDDQGYIWRSKTDFTTNCTRLDTDTTGAAFSNNVQVYGMANTTATIRSDGSVWYMGDDTFHLFHTTGGVQMRPTQLSPSGMVVTQVALGGRRVVVLTSSGQVWEWTYNNGLTPIQKTIPRPAIYISASHLDYAVCLIPNTTGGQNVGYPYVWGNYYGAWGGNGSLNQPTSMTVPWNVTVPIQSIELGWNTTHYIDSLSRLFGMGFNSNGEVGNGQEFVNKYTYSTFPAYSWTLADGENFSGTPPTQIGSGVKWVKLYKNQFFMFYVYALDAGGNTWSWGRNKALDLGNGYLNMQEQFSPNAMDVLVPTQVQPWLSVFQKYNFTAPTISAGNNQTINVNNVTLTGSATPPKLSVTATATNPVTYPVNNGIATLPYVISTYTWTQTAGPNTSTIATPNAATTSVTNLITGTYTFNLKTVDNNTGTQSANVNITVSASTAPSVSAGPNQAVTLPVNQVTLNGSASGNGGATISSVLWTATTAAGTYIITSPNTVTTTVTNLVAGTYTFNLQATDSNNNVSNASCVITVIQTPVGTDYLIFKRPHVVF